MSYKNSTTGYFRFLIIAILIAIPILGVVFDLGISLKQMPILVKIEDLREFSLVLIQIQATIVTLTLSVISILSGFLSDFYKLLFFRNKSTPINTQKNNFCRVFITGS